MPEPITPEEFTKECNDYLTALQAVSDWYYANLKTSEFAEFKEMEADQLDTVCNLYLIENGQ